MKTTSRFEAIEEVWLNAITAGKGVFPDDASIKRFAAEVVRARSENRPDWLSADDVREYLLGVKGYSIADADRFVKKFVEDVNASETEKTFSCRDGY